MKQIKIPSQLYGESLKRTVLDYSLITIGAFILAAGFVFFINPYNIVPGGVYGIGIVVHHLIPAIPVGTFGLILNVPLTLLGIRILGARFGLKTVLGMILTTIFMDGLTYFIGENDPLGLADDLLLSCVFGGIVIGFGLGLIFKAKATSGGSDIVAMILAKFTKISVGQLLMVVDSVIVLVGLIVFKDWKIPLYSWIVIFITGKVIDITIDGLNYERALVIVSEKHELIKEKILYTLERGGTYLKGEGMFSGDNKRVIFTVVTRREVSALQAMIKHIDPKAFMAVMETSEIIGEGFKSLEEKSA
ncbi:YitT family protein [Carboxylicivirga sediminis]|uniref:YitT family protein n=1 Tax=Carboxylicivirga sediminis TaxID=2006564 RepID=A0A941F6Y9_9BACT|nr:YitT family protein [Carboxylicivirga sediminis]MBR8537587.1 YitT family protein [Carboxylicivirga sediminis]